MIGQAVAALDSSIVDVRMELMINCAAILSNEGISRYRRHV
jgi:hypothetical protein